MRIFCYFSYFCVLVITSLATSADEKTANQKKLPSYQKIVLSDKFHAEGACIGDFNKDGILDVAVGHYWYAGPDFKKSFQIFEGSDFDPEKYSDCFGMMTFDFNHDGWDDILICPPSGKDGYWFENPKNRTDIWKKHFVTKELGNESQQMVDFFGDGKPYLLFNRNGFLGFATPNAENPYVEWDFTAISPEDKRFFRYTHGIGYGDINGNGKNDIIEREGWWEQPMNPKDVPWKFHPFPFADAAAHLIVVDVDGDGLNDVVTALHCHLYGFAWYRQVRKDNTEEISFEQNILIPMQPEDTFSPKISQLHAQELADMNGNGIPDVITGKRFWAHGSKGDVAPNDPAILIWWETKRDGKKSTLIPHVIDENSGVGTQFAVGDLNADEIPDIVIGNKKGAFIFLSQSDG